MARSLLVVGLLVLCSCGRERIGQAQRVAAAPRVGAAQVPAALPLPLEPADADGSQLGGRRRPGPTGQADTRLPGRRRRRRGRHVRRRRASGRSHRPALGARPSAVLVTPAGRIVVLGADDARAHVLVMTQVDRPLVRRTFGRRSRRAGVRHARARRRRHPRGQSMGACAHRRAADRHGRARSSSICRAIPRRSSLRPTAVARSSCTPSARGPASSTSTRDRCARSRSIGRSRSRARTGGSRKLSVLRSIARANMFLGGIDESQGPAQADGEAPSRRRDASDTITLHADQAFAAVRVKDGVVAPLVPWIPGADDRSVGYGGRSAAVTASVVSFDETGLGAPRRPARLRPLPSPARRLDRPGRGGGSSSPAWGATRSRSCGESPRHQGRADRARPRRSGRGVRRRIGQARGRLVGVLSRGLGPHARRTADGGRARPRWAPRPPRRRPTPLGAASSSIRTSTGASRPTGAHARAAIRTRATTGSRGRRPAAGARRRCSSSASPERRPTGGTAAPLTSRIISCTRPPASVAPGSATAMPPTSKPTSRLFTSRRPMATTRSSRAAGTCLVPRAPGAPAATPATRSQTATRTTSPARCPATSITRSTRRRCISSRTPRPISTTAAMPRSPSCSRGPTARWVTPRSFTRKSHGPRGVLAAALARAPA